MKRGVFACILMFLSGFLSGVESADAKTMEGASIVERGGQLQSAVHYTACPMVVIGVAVGRFHGYDTDNAGYQAEQDERERCLHHMYAQRPPIPDYVVREAEKSENMPNSRYSLKARLMILSRLVEHLDLEEKTATEFFPVYLAYMNNRNKIYHEHRELTREIAKRAEDESVPVAELRRELDRLGTYEDEIEKERKDFLKKAENILDDRQYIKLLIFNDKLKEDLILLIREERSRRRPDDDSDRGPNDRGRPSR